LIQRENKKMVSWPCGQRKSDVIFKKRSPIPGREKRRSIGRHRSSARFTRTPDVFYYKIGDGELHEIESIKSMIASFPERQEELTSMQKRKRYRTKRETLVQFVQYYNSL